MLIHRTVAYSLLGWLSLSAFAATDTKAPASALPSNPTAAAAATLAASVPHLTAKQIVDKNVAARGGLAAWRRVKSMRMTGKMDVGRLRKQTFPVSMTREQMHTWVQQHAKAEDNQKDVVQLPFVMELQRPRKVRFELQVAGDTAVQVYDGEHGWKLRPYLNRRDVESFTPDEMQSAAQQQELDGLLIDSDAKGNKVELAGIEQVEGRAAYKLKVTLKSSEVRSVWIDAQTFLEIKVDGVPRSLDGKPHAVATYFRDYKSVDGLTIPYVLETTVERVKDSQKITIERVEINPALSDSRFARPT